MSVEPDQSLFEYSHLPEHLQSVSERFGELAFELYRFLPRGAERAVCLRKLLEAKDAGVRASLDVRTPEPQTIRELVLRCIAEQPGQSAAEIAAALSAQAFPTSEQSVWFALGFLVQDGVVGALIENDVPVWLPRDPGADTNG